MKSSDKFLNMMQDLIVEVERQAGTHLPDRCSSKTYKLVFKNEVGKDSVNEIRIPGCGNESLFMVRYHPEAEVKILANTEKGKRKVFITHKGDKGEGFAKVCAVDDRMDLWPRFAHAVGNEE